MRPRLLPSVVLTAVALSGLIAPNATRLSAQTAPKALVLGTTVSGGADSREARAARALGFAVTVVDAAAWGALTSADFTAYDLIILGDPDCVGDPGPLAPAQANRSAWSAAATGNIVLILTDPDFHAPSTTAAQTLMQNAVAYAGASPGEPVYMCH